MFIAPDKTRGAFTLLEIVIAVAILGLMALSIYRFVQTNITALRVSSEITRTDEQYSGLTNLLAEEWQSLAPGKGALIGEPLKLNDEARDEMTWINTAGPGLLTRYAAGEYSINLRVRPTAKNSAEMEIGITRKGLMDSARGEEARENWVSLLPNVRSLQIRYFDPRLNTWVERWTDTVTLPRLVKLNIGRGNNSIPWEAIVPLGRTPL